ncbi:MAG TPA: glycosyltransferase, partial [Pirellulaceae bacterium]|nr:glycosyltransferase [Pirellulaceae bacterium]
MTTSLRVLLTNCAICGPSGTEMYIFDVALRLLARGHRPLVYSPVLGPLAQRLSTATISVVNDLALIPDVPDVIHGQHSLETLQALLHFPRTPAIYVCHDWNWVGDTPPKLPRVRRFVAVDETVRDRLLVQEGIAESLVEVIFNGVDLDRFQPRPSLPRRPQKALVISNYLERSQLDVISAACRRQAIELDAIGAKLGGTCPRPEEVLGQYDLVFAKGRCAWESLAVGAAVIVCDTWGVGPLVTTAQLASLRRANFGRRLLQQPLRVEVLAREIARYDAADAEEVSRQIRATAGVDRMVDRLLECYAVAIRQEREVVSTDLVADMRAAAAFLRAWPPHEPLPSPGSNCECLPTDA